MNATPVARVPSPRRRLMRSVMTSGEAAALVADRGGAGVGRIQPVIFPHTGDMAVVGRTVDPR